MCMVCLLTSVFGLLTSVCADMSISSCTGCGHIIRSLVVSNNCVVVELNHETNTNHF